MSTPDLFAGISLAHPTWPQALEESAKDLERLGATLYNYLSESAIEELSREERTDLLRILANAQRLRRYAVWLETQPSTGR